MSKLIAIVGLVCLAQSQGIQLPNEKQEEIHALAQESVDPQQSVSVELKRNLQEEMGLEHATSAHEPTPWYTFSSDEDDMNMKYTINHATNSAEFKIDLGDSKKGSAKPCEEVAGFKIPFTNVKLEFGKTDMNIKCDNRKDGSGMDIYMSNLTDADIGGLSAKKESKVVFYFKTADVDSYMKMQDTYCSSGSPDIKCKKTQAGSEFSFLTYNMYLLKGKCFFDFCTEPDVYQNQRLQLFVEQYLSRYDVLSLQEVWFGDDDGRKLKLIQEAYKRGIEYHAIPPADYPIEKFNDGGLLILSRYPIVESQYRPFEWFESGMKPLSWKGVLYAKIEARPGVFLHVFDVHTRNGAKTITPVKQRNEHLKQVRAFLDEKTKKIPESDLVIVNGDMNIDARFNSEYKMKPFAKLLELESDAALELRKHKEEFTTQYETFMKIMAGDKGDKAIDVMLEGQGRHPATFGELEITKLGEFHGIENGLTSKQSLGSNQYLDYIIQVVPKKVTKAALRKNPLHISYSVTQVEKMKVTGQKDFTQLSDHYGVVTKIQVSNPTGIVAAAKMGAMGGVNIFESGTGLILLIDAILFVLAAFTYCKDKNEYVQLVEEGAAGEQQPKQEKTVYQQRLEDSDPILLKLLKKYNKFVQIFCQGSNKDAPLSRTQKVVLLDMEIFALLAFQCFQVLANPGFSTVAGIAFTFIFMRVLNIVFAAIQATIKASQNKMLKAVLEFGFPLAVSVIAHTIVLGFLLNATAYEFADWRSAALVNSLFEFGAWSFVIMPVGVAVLSNAGMTMLEAV